MTEPRAGTVTVRVDDLVDVIDRVLNLPLAEQPHWKVIGRLTSDSAVSRGMKELANDRLRP